MTSLLSRLTSAPVRVRVKNATGWRWTWSNTAPRRSRIRSSPRREEYQRCRTPTAASATAMTAISTATPITVPRGPPRTIASTTRPASTGIATASTAPTTLTTRNAESRRRCGRANAAIRRSVALDNRRRSWGSWPAWYIACQATISMLIAVPRARRWSSCRLGWRASSDLPSTPTAGGADDDRDGRTSTKVQVNHTGPRRDVGSRASRSGGVDREVPGRTSYPFSCRGPRPSRRRCRPQRYCSVLL